MLKKILFALLIIVAALAVIVGLQPAEYQVVRSTVIAAPPALVFEQVNDFHNWQAWSPWARRDPAMKQTYEGLPAGTGAVYIWDGNKDVGAGRMTVIESRPNEFVKIKLEFFRPFAGTAASTFALKPESDRTAVTWSIAGEKNFIGKAIHLFISMDKMIGGDFEQGLAQMKSVAESTPGK
ncbi:MAG TPA: SRPBCC family protein [Candidatus Binatia bacterium]|jgi:hypothetical protein